MEHPARTIAFCVVLFGWMLLAYVTPSDSRAWYAPPAHWLWTQMSTITTGGRQTEAGRMTP